MLDLIERQIKKGIQAGVELEAENLKDKISAEGPSSPGEYLGRDTGQTEKNVFGGVQDGKEAVGGVGVFGESTPIAAEAGHRITGDGKNIGGLALYYHEQGSGPNPFTVLGQRQGIEASFLEDAAQIASEIEKVAKL